MSGRLTLAGSCVAILLFFDAGMLHGGDEAEESVVTSAISGCLSAEGDKAECGGGYDAEAEYGPHWAVSVDGLFLDRRGPAAAELMFNQADLTQNLNASEFNYGVDAGFDVSGVWNLNRLVGIEVRYFALDPWNSTVRVPTTPGDPLQINTVRPLVVQAGSSIMAACRSDLENFELSGRRQVGEWLTLLAGFRYLELDERFQAVLTGAELPFGYEAATRNRLYGAQLGGQVLLWGGCGRLTVEGAGKAGIFANHADQDSAFSTGTVSLPAQGAKSATAFVGELGLWANGCLTDRLSVRAGYRLLWVDGVALATDQLAASDFIFANGITTSGDAFYHGAFAGLQYGW